MAVIWKLGAFSETKRMIRRTCLLSMLTFDRIVAAAYITCKNHLGERDNLLKQDTQVLFCEIAKIDLGRRQGNLQRRNQPRAYRARSG